jgi:hypothetical protein
MFSDYKISNLNAVFKINSPLYTGSEESNYNLTIAFVDHSLHNTKKV